MDIYNKIVIHITGSSTSEEGKRYILESEKRFYETTKAVADLIVMLQKCQTHEEAIISYVKSTNGKYNPEDIIHVIQNNINPLLSYLPVEEKTFLYQKEILSSSTVDIFSNNMSFLFKRNILLSVITFAIILDLIFLLCSGHIMRFNDVNVYIMIGLAFFTLFSTILHELGHASACKYYGVKHGGIGFGLYLNFPLLYTDVTEAWKLDRNQRNIVNIAGVYFQLYLLVLLVLVFLFTGDSFTGYLILAMNLGFIMTLNPFFKFDGYWIVSDLLGIPNLRKQSKELVKYGFDLLIGQNKGAKPLVLKISLKKKIGLLVYSIVVNLFLIFYFFYIIPNFIFGFVQSCSYMVHLFDLYISKKECPPLSILFSFAMQSLFAVFILYFLINIIRTVLRKKNA